LILPSVSGIICSVTTRKQPGNFVVKAIKIVVERHPDTYLAYPLGVRGVVVGEGDTYEKAADDLKSALRFHMETFGDDVLDVDPPILEAFTAETGVLT
jgi:predicted RNase H-like HicB family nuclease